MSENVIFFGWNQTISGREKMSADHFREFVEFLTGLQKKGTIQTFDPVFLDFHGGDMNGFFLIKGEGKKLEALTDSEDWIRHTIRASFHLEGFGIVRGVTGDVLNERMQLWTKNIPD